MTNDIKPVLHLVSNAHIDPVWQWRYEEGLSETLPTFWNAIHFLEEFPEYVFVHNESLLYEFVEKNDPDLFSEIRRFVQEGRWIIVGGWYLQPDCNLPGGESFVRHILYGRRYFLEKFGVGTNVAYNLDSFGHNGGIPQILVKSGYKYYIHYRPEKSVLDVPGDTYVWKGVDGSEVLACRPTLGWYLTEWNPVGERPGHRGFIHERIQESIKRIQETGKCAISFWGVGNHGGGASRSELEQIREAVETLRSVEIRHSHPEAYFKSIETYRNSLPVINGSLRHCFRGCYVSSARIKRCHRECEGLLDQVERLSCFAEYFANFPYPVEELQEAWKDLLFNQFHDAVAGCSSEEVNLDIMETFGHCSTIARQIRLRALIALTKPGAGVSGIPVFVFNPHSFPFRGPVQADFVIDYRPIYTGTVTMLLCDPEGNRIPFQQEIPSSLLGREWRKRYVFWAEVPPLCFARYTIQNVDELPDPEPTIKSSLDDGFLRIDTTALQALFDIKSGLLVSLFDKNDDRNVLKAPGIIPLVMEDEGDSWANEIDSFSRVVGEFQAADPDTLAETSGYHLADESQLPVRIIEKGPVRIVVETVLSYHKSTIRLVYRFYPKVPFFEISMRINWYEPRRILKMAFATTLDNAVVKTEVSYGTEVCVSDGTEQIGQRWLLLESEDHAFGIINTGQYGFDVKQGEARLSILRSPAYCHWGTYQLCRDRSYSFMDMGEHDLLLGIVIGDPDTARKETLRYAYQMNIPAISYPFFSNARGVGKQGTLFEIRPETVIISALKKAEDRNGYIVRIHESAGMRTVAELSVLEGRQIKRISMRPYEIKTLRMTPTSNAFQIEEVDLLERR